MEVRHRARLACVALRIDLEPPVALGKGAGIEVDVREPTCRGGVVEIGGATVSGRSVIEMNSLKHSVEVPLGLHWPPAAGACGHPSLEVIRMGKNRRCAVDRTGTAEDPSPGMPK